MIESLKIVNFKGISSQNLTFSPNINLIIGQNGVGKTNILESIGLLFGHDFFSYEVSSLIQKDADMFFLESCYQKNNIPHKISLSLDKKSLKKNLILNNKKPTKRIFDENSIKVCHFLPFTMNLFYLGPKYRRAFLDDIIKNIDPNMKSIYSKYDMVVKSRNRVLKNIFENKSSPDEIHFWNNETILYAGIIYEKRYELIEFINQNIQQFCSFFGVKVDNISFHYISKIQSKNYQEEMKQYFEKNFQRDILLQKTHIGPHLDDFEILADGYAIQNYASRGETKSIIIGLKLLELAYLKKHTGQDALFLIDDLMSELDEIHINLLLEKLKNHQVIITNIVDIKAINGTKIFI